MARGWSDQAKRYGAPLAFLLAATIAVLLVRSGLRGDAAPDTASAPTATVVTPTTRTATPPRQRRFYRLRAGETLSDVAIRFDTSVEQLLVLNPGIEPTNLTVGQRVRVK
ncbi:MAG: LysM peptidoglycan-binding domain-containing protein [Gaiellaceae bacterium]